MSRFGTIPREVPRHANLDECAPKFAAKIRELVTRLEAQGYDPLVYEALRTDERCAWLYGFGREYDDGRGLVTNAATGAKSWHHYGLAVDIISRAKEWSAADGFWAAVRTEASALGLESGGNWKMADRPHVQWGAPMRTTPSDHAWELLRASGMQAVWNEVGAAA
jgi:hypothetical protein